MFHSVGAVFSFSPSTCEYFNWRCRLPLCSEYWLQASFLGIVDKTKHVFKRGSFDDFNKDWNMSDVVFPKIWEEKPEFWTVLAKAVPQTHRHLESSPCNTRINFKPKVLDKKIWRSYHLSELIANDRQLAPSIDHFCHLNLNIIWSCFDSIKKLIRWLGRSVVVRQGESEKEEYDREDMLTTGSM